MHAHIEMAHVQNDITSGVAAERRISSGPVLTAAAVLTSVLAFGILYLAGDLFYFVVTDPAIASPLFSDWRDRAR